MGRGSSSRASCAHVIAATSPSRGPAHRSRCSTTSSCAQSRSVRAVRRAATAAACALHHVTIADQSPGASNRGSGTPSAVTPIRGAGSRPRASGQCRAPTARSTASARRSRFTVAGVTGAAIARPCAGVPRAPFG